MMPSLAQTTLTVLDELGALSCTLVARPDGRRGLIFSREAATQPARVGVATPEGAVDGSVYLVIDGTMGLTADPDGALQLAAAWQDGVALFARHEGATIRLTDASGRRVVLREDGALALRAGVDAGCQDIALTDRGNPADFTTLAWRRRLVLALHGGDGLVMLSPADGHRLLVANRPALWTVEPWDPAAPGASQYRLSCAGAWLSLQGVLRDHRAVACSTRPQEAARVEFRRHRAGWFQLRLDGKLLHVDAAGGACFVHAGDRPAHRFESGARFDDLPLLWLAAPGGAQALEARDGHVELRPRRADPAQAWLRHDGRLVSLAGGRCLAWSKPEGNGATALRLDAYAAPRTSWVLGRNGLAPAGLPGWLARPDANGRLELRQEAMLPTLAQWDLFTLPDLPGRPGADDDSFAIEAASGSLFTLVNEASGQALTAPDEADSGVTLTVPAAGAAPRLAQLWAMAGPALVAANGMALRHDETGALVSTDSPAAADRWAHAADQTVWRAAEDWSVLMADGATPRVAAFDPTRRGAARWKLTGAGHGAPVRHAMVLARPAPATGTFVAVGGMALRLIPGTRKVAFAFVDVSPPGRVDLVSGTIDVGPAPVPSINVRERVNARPRPVLTGAADNQSFILIQSQMGGDGTVAVAVKLSSDQGGVPREAVHNANYVGLGLAPIQGMRPAPHLSGDPLNIHRALGTFGRLVDVAGAPPGGFHLISPYTANNRNYVVPARIWQGAKGYMGCYSGNPFGSYPVVGAEWVGRSPACVQLHNDIWMFCLSAAGVCGKRLPGGQYVDDDPIPPAQLKLDGVAHAADVAAAVSGERVLLAFTSHDAVWSCCYDPASRRASALRRLAGTEGSSAPPALAVHNDELILGWAAEQSRAGLNFYQVADLID